MTVVSSSYRSVEHISNKVKEMGGFEEYLKSITPSTTRNYKKYLIDYVKTHESNSVYLINKIREASVVKDDSSNLRKQLVSIFNRIKINSMDSDVINIAEDLEFLIFIALIDEKNKEKIKLKNTDISFEEKNETIIISVKNEKKYIITNQLDLFKKALLSNSKKYGSFNLFKTNSFIKLLETQFLRSGFEYSRDLKSLKSYIKLHYVKESL